VLPLMVLPMLMAKAIARTVAMAMVLMAIARTVAMVMILMPMLVQPASEGEAKAMLILLRKPSEGAFGFTVTGEFKGKSDADIVDELMRADCVADQLGIFDTYPIKYVENTHVKYPVLSLYFALRSGKHVGPQWQVHPLNSLIFFNASKCLSRGQVASPS
jgi:hypothetical protein